MRASLVIAIVVAITGCLSGRVRPGSTLPPRPCTYRVSRRARVPSLAVGAPYRAVITATVTDSSGQPLPTASVARMPGGPGVYTDAQGRAVVRLSERDVGRTDSTNIMVRRVGSMAMAIPVRIAAGDSVDIVASMCPGRHWLSNANARPAMGPAHDHSAAGAGIGAIAGSVVGYLSGRGRGAISGGAIGALLGYGTGHLFTSHSACMPADVHGRSMVASMRALVDTNDVRYRDLRARWRIPAAAPTQVYLGTDERVCRRARQALDSLIRATNPRAPGLKQFPSVYVVRAGNVLDVDTPGTYSVNIFDATTWKFIGALVTPD